MAIASSIKRTNALGNSIDSGKNPKTLAEKDAFNKYLYGDQAYKAAYDDYLADEGKLAGPAAYDYEEWKKAQNLKGKPRDNEEAMLKYTKLYYPEYLADVTEYYASFNPSTPKTTKGQTYVPEAWKPKPVEGIAPPNPNINSSNYEDQEQYEADLAAGKINAKGEVISSETNTSTDTDTSGTDTNEHSKADAAFDFLMKLFGTYNNDINASRSQLADRAWQMIESYWKENPLETDWGKGILDYYGVLGDNSANAVNAATAAENAGNIDSYAAANAERQRVAKLGQGIQSVMGMSAERFNNMIAGLESIGVNTERLFGAQGDLVGNARQYATDLYKTDADTTNEYNKLLYSGSGDTTYNLSDEGIKAHLMDTYKSFNTVEGNPDEIDWSATDKAIWDDVIEALQKDGIYSQLSPTYIKNLIAQIMQAQSETASEETETAEGKKKSKSDPNWWWLNSMWN